MNRALGVDIDGPIVTLPTGVSRNFLSDADMKRCEVQAGCISRLGSLHRRGWGGRIYLFAVANEQYRNLYLDWLARNHFRDSGIVLQNVLFYDSPERLVTACSGMLLTHFIARHVGLLRKLNGIVEHRIWFKPLPADLKAQANQLTGVSVVQNWRDVEDFVSRRFDLLPEDPRGQRRRLHRIFPSYSGE